MAITSASATRRGSQPTHTGEYKPVARIATLSPDTTSKWTVPVRKNGIVSSYGNSSRTPKQHGGRESGLSGPTYVRSVCWP